jgi:hypothetical protein
MTSELDPELSYEQEMALRKVVVDDHNHLWKAKWPNYCRSCGGWGLHSFQESHGFRFGSSETIIDPCGALAETMCHRCGNEGMDPDHERACFFCGWHEDDGLMEI